MDRGDHGIVINSSLGKEALFFGKVVEKSLPFYPSPILDFLCPLSFFILVDYSGGFYPFLQLLRYSYTALSARGSLALQPAGPHP